ANLWTPDENEPHHPVNQVSWWHAFLFARWAGAALPTDAQWEYACRAGTPPDWPYWSGHSEADLAAVAWYEKNGGGRTHRVGEKNKPSPWGMHDMHGNVWEWCRDWAGELPREPQQDPCGPLAGRGRVVRGGSFVAPAAVSKSGFRAALIPAEVSAQIGFRVVGPTSDWHPHAVG
ncbi:MAG: formylglycine-generating enzyme family protein, partial [Verrucomicrobiae bacterium]|nr:formylglycine-generating enzyme family protein [Verrucomicrobiae bacterium]